MDTEGRDALLPHSRKRSHLSRSMFPAVRGQRRNVTDGTDGCCVEEGQTSETAQEGKNSHKQKVKVITTALHQVALLPVDDHSAHAWNYR